LREQQFIRKLIAAILLITFSISSAPKLYFHEVFADHIDQPSCTDPVNTPVHLHQQTINCHFDDLVVSTPFFLSNGNISVQPVQLNNSIGSEYLPSSIPLISLCKESRGPPVM